MSLSNLARRLSFRKNKSDTTENKSNSLKRSKANSEQKNFWDIDGYKAALERCDNGFKLVEDVKEMITERAKIDKCYSESLYDWNKKWSDKLKKSEEYGQNMLSDWQNLINESSLDKIKYHIELYNNIRDSIVQQLDDYLKQNSKKTVLGIGVGHWPKTNEFRDDFIEAQQQWSSLHKQLEKYQKEHDKLCLKLEHLNCEANSEKEKTLREHSKAIENCKRIYRNMELNKDTYQKDMTLKFNQTEDFEEYRMCLIRDVFQEGLKLIKNTDKLDDMPKNIRALNLKSDLKYWSDHYGIGNKLNMPKVCFKCEHKNT